MPHNYGIFSVALLVEATRYKPVGRGFGFRSGHWYFTLTQSFRPHYGPGVDSASNRNEYQGCLLGGKDGRCVRRTTLPPSCADCITIYEPQIPAPLRSWPTSHWSLRSPPLKPHTSRVCEWDTTVTTVKTSHVTSECSSTTNCSPHCTDWHFITILNDKMKVCIPL